MLTWTVSHLAVCYCMYLDHKIRYFFNFFCNITLKFCAIDLVYMRRYDSNCPFLVFIAHLASHFDPNAGHVTDASLMSSMFTNNIDFFIFVRSKQVS